MSGPENTFIGSVHRELPSIDLLYRMKNHNEYNGGIADCWYSGSKDLWIEYKFVVVPVRPGTLIDLVGGKKPDVSMLQQMWIRGRLDEGRSVWLIVGSKSGGIIYKDMSFMQPISAAAYKERMLSRQEIARAIRGHCQ